MTNHLIADFFAPVRSAKLASLNDPLLKLHAVDTAILLRTRETVAGVQQTVRVHRTNRPISFVQSPF
jgi:hypothetical protein